MTPVFTVEEGNNLTTAEQLILVNDEPRFSNVSSPMCALEDLIERRGHVCVRSVRTCTWR